MNSVSPAKTETAVEMRPGCGRHALRNYVDTVLARLEKSPGMSPTELRGKVMPFVVGSIRSMVGGAPADVKGTIKGALEAASVLPAYEADVEGFKGVLRKIRQILAGAGPNDREVVTPPAKPAIDEGLWDEKPLTSKKQSTLGHRLRSMSVRHPSTTFLDEVKAMGLERAVNVYKIEPLVFRRPMGHLAVCRQDQRRRADRKVNKDFLKVLAHWRTREERAAAARR